MSFCVAGRFALNAFFTSADSSAVSDFFPSRSVSCSGDSAGGVGGGGDAGGGGDSIKG